MGSKCHEGEDDEQDDQAGWPANLGLFLTGLFMTAFLSCHPNLVHSWLPFRETEIMGRGVNT